MKSLLKFPMFSRLSRKRKDTVSFSQILKVKSQGKYKNPWLPKKEQKLRKLSLAVWMCIHYLTFCSLSIKALRILSKFQSETASKKS